MLENQYFYFAAKREKEKLGEESHLSLSYPQMGWVGSGSRS